MPVILLISNVEMTRDYKSTPHLQRPLFSHPILFAEHLKNLELIQFGAFFLYLLLECESSTFDNLCLWKMTHSFQQKCQAQLCTVQYLEEKAKFILSVKKCREKERREKNLAAQHFASTSWWFMLSCESSQKNNNNNNDNDKKINAKRHF